VCGADTIFATLWDSVTEMRRRVCRTCVSLRLFSIMSDDHIPIRIHSISQVEAYQVTVEELDSIKREGSNVGLDFQVSEFCLTVAIAFLIALFTTKIESDRTFTIFVVLVVVGFVLGFVFGLKWYMNRGSINRLFARIEARQIGPSGDATHQIQPLEVAKLVPVAAPSTPLPQSTEPEAAPPVQVPAQPQQARQEP
jgi:hypothetical protein